MHTVMRLGLLYSWLNTFQWAIYHKPLKTLDRLAIAARRIAQEHSHYLSAGKYHQEARLAWLQGVFTSSFIFFLSFSSFWASLGERRWVTNKLQIFSFPRPILIANANRMLQSYAVFHMMMCHLEHTKAYIETFRTTVCHFVLLLAMRKLEFHKRKNKSRGTSKKFSPVFVTGHTHHPRNSICPFSLNLSIRVILYLIF